ncbi:glycosyltransferase [Clostridium sp.]|uniref:glycosyltransferase family 2 protein n=1 Tax=Clostridium sp. TaxID=1506 RepID=UPI002FCB9754
MDILSSFIKYYSYLMFGYFILVNFFYVGLIFISIKRLKKFVKIVNSDITSTSDYTKPISIVVPAFNEQETIIDNIKSLLELNYPSFEVIVVNDGSNDETLKKVIQHYNLSKVEMDINIQIPCKEIKNIYSSLDFSNLVVVDKKNGGKADALNAGINISKYPLFCGIDADCIIEKNALLRIVKPFLKHEETIAVGGIVRIANGCEIKDGKLVRAKLPKNIIAKFQIIEYFRAFLTSRVGWEVLNSLLIISGAFGLFKKSAVIDVGGYKRTIGEDMELTLRIHQHYRKKKIKYKVDFTSDAVCWTQAPESLKGLRIQRIRWHRGLIDAIYRNKIMLFNPKYGYVGLLAMPYFCLIEMLGPVIEIIGYVVMILAIVTGLTSKYMIYIFLLAYLYGILFSLSGVLFEQTSYKRYKGYREIGTMVFYSFLEQFCYRQLTVWWRIQGFWNFREGRKEWGTIERKSFTMER